MSQLLTARFHEQIHTVVAAGIAALTSTAGDAAYVSMKGYRKCTIQLFVDNGSTVTGGTITLKQASAVAGTGEKALGFDRMYANTDLAAGQAPDDMVETAVTSNTFTTGTTDNKNMLYEMEVDAEDLDSANGFTSLRLDSTGMVNASGVVFYHLWGARYSGTDPTID